MKQKIYTLSIDGVSQASGRRARMYKILAERMEGNTDKWGSYHDYLIAEVNMEEDGKRDDEVVEKGLYMTGVGIVDTDIRGVTPSAKYIKLPLEVEAFKYFGCEKESDIETYPDWFTRAFYLYDDIKADDETGDLLIHSQEGTYRVHTGDYIIRNIRGEIIARTEDNFEEAYVHSEEYLSHIYNDLGVEDFVDTEMQNMEDQIINAYYNKAEELVQQIQEDVDGLIRENRREGNKRTAMVAVLIVVTAIIQYLRLM